MKFSGDCQASQDNEEKEQLLRAAKKQMKLTLSKCEEVQMEAERHPNCNHTQ